MLHLNRKVITAICLLTLAAAESAASAPRSHFLSYGPSAAASGMGEANAAYALDAGAVYYNPALIYNLRDQVTASHWFLYDGARYNFVGVVTNGPKSAFGLAGTQFARNNIEVRKNLADAGETAQNSQIAAYGTFASRLERLRLTYGLSVKWLRYSMYNSAGSGFSMDLGFARPLVNRVYSMGKRLSVSAGFAASNLYQTGLKLETENEKLPTALRAELAAQTTLRPRYSKESNKLSYDNLTGALGIKNEDGGTIIITGVQYTLLQQYMFRAGYNRGATVGLGYKFGDLVFDYALMMKDLANFHRVGFSYNFGRPAVETGTTEQITDDFQNVYQKAIRIYERFIRTGEDLIKQNRPDDARAVLVKATPLNPKNNSQAKELLLVCDKMILSKKTGDLVSKANLVVSSNTAAAVDNYLEAYRLSGDSSFLVAAKGIETPEGAAAGRLKVFTEDLIKTFNGLLEANSFTPAEKQLALLKPLVDVQTSSQLQDVYNDRKGIYVAKLLGVAVESMQKNDALKAYKYFKEAHRLSSDSGIKDQIELAKEKQLNGKKYSIEDNIYADKLYYQMAYMFATDDRFQVIRNELAGFNPFYDTEEFSASLAESGKEKPEVLGI